MQQAPTAICLTVRPFESFFIGRRKTDAPPPVPVGGQWDAGAVEENGATAVQVYKMFHQSGGVHPVWRTKIITRAELACAVLHLCGTFVPERPIPIRAIHSWFGKTGMPVFRVEFCGDDPVCETTSDTLEQQPAEPKQQEIQAPDDESQTVPAIDPMSAYYKSLSSPACKRPLKMSDECFRECLDYILPGEAGYDDYHLPSLEKISRWGCQGNCKKPDHYPKAMIAISSRVLLDDERNVWAIKEHATYTLNGEEIERARGPYERTHFIHVLVPMVMPHNEPIASVASGKSHTLLLGFRGQVYLLGTNDHGQFGNGERSSGSSRVPVMNTHLPPIQSICSSGGDFSLVVDDEGCVWGFGDNRNGQLGVKCKVSGTRRSESDENEKCYDVLIPTKVPLGFQVKLIACGSKHAVLTDQIDDLWCFGCASGGRLGLGRRYLDKKTPIPPTRMKDALVDCPQHPIAHIAANHAMTVVQDKSGALWAWGSFSRKCFIFGEFPFWPPGRVSSSPLQLTYDFAYTGAHPKTATKNARSQLSDGITCAPSPLGIENSSSVRGADVGDETDAAILHEHSTLVAHQARNDPKPPESLCTKKLLRDGGENSQPRSLSPPPKRKKQ